MPAQKIIVRPQNHSVLSIFLEVSLTVTEP